MLTSNRIEGSPAGSLRYRYSTELRRCTNFKYLGCGGNENNFGTMNECSEMCEDPCTLPMDEGEGSVVIQGKDGNRQEVSCKE